MGGLIPLSMREYVQTCSSLEGPIRNNLTLFGFILPSFLFRNFSNRRIKYQKGQYYEDNKPIVTFPHQSEIEYLILFLHLMPIGVPRVPFRIPGEEYSTWVDI